MSLLLDALKKAAEQKARQAEAGSGKTGDEQTEELSSKDDTVVSEESTIGYEDRTEAIDDDTEISEDPTEEATRSTRAEEDVTDLYDQDETHSYPDGPEFSEDETHIDETNLVEEETILSGSASAEDETTSIDETTEHIQPAATDPKDETEFDPITEYGSATEDDTILDSQDAAEETEMRVESAAQQGDSDVTMRSSEEDETAPIDSERDVAEFMGDSVDDSTQSTDYSTQPSHDPTQSIDDDTDLTQDSFEDLSLLLADDHDDDTETKDDSTTKRSSYVERAEDDSDPESLRLIDREQETATQTSTITDQKESAASRVELESLRHEHTIVRPDATSTHTYAPDNYDRTLIRPPTEDASRIFAGMKAEEDVLMTPDYAKRVFLSKSSANRMQHYKVYAGIGLSVFLAIGIFSMFELVDESNLIDSTMSPLKRDPMPGIIRSDNNQGNVNVFDTAGEPDVDLETLKLVESAGSEESTEGAVNDETEISGSADASTGSEDVQSQSDAADNQVTDNVESGDKTVEPPTGATQVATTETTTSAGSLQISSSSKVSELDQWLADGYAAYQMGDDASALQNYNQVLAIEPSNRNALLARAAIKVQNGDTSSAILDYQELLLANPKDSLAMSSLISIARTAPQESESQLKLMIRDEPASPHLNFVLANVYSAQNRWQEAQGLYFIALQNKPGDPNYAYNLAVSLEHISKPEAAITYYERAVANIRNGLATFDKNLVDSRIEMLKQL